jgi:hypothetical protein
MNSAEKLKSFLQQQFDSQQIPVSPGEWEQARRYLDARRKSRRIGLYRFFGAAVIAFIGGWMVTRQLIPANNIVAERATATPARAVSKSVMNGNRPEDATSLTMTEPEIPTKEIISSETGTSPVRGVKPSYAAETNMKKAVTESTMTEINNTQDNDSEIEDTKALLTATLKEEEDKPVTDEVVSDESNGRTLQIAGSTLTPVMTPVLASMVSEFTNPAGPVATEQVAAKSTELPTVQQDAIHEEAAPSPGVTDVPAPADISTDNLAPDTTNTVSAPITPCEWCVPGDGIFYEIGAAGFYGWNSPMGHDANGLSPVVGISYINEISTRIALAFGVQYNRIGGLGVSGKTSKVISFGFGEESDITVITPTTLHYLVAPLRVQYFQRNRHVFGAGLNVGYLLNVDAKVISYRQFPGNTSGYSETKLSGYTEGFSWFDLQGAVSYGIRIRKSLTAQAELFCGLTDVKNDDFFKLTYYERNMGAKVTLIYYTSRKN